MILGFSLKNTALELFPHFKNSGHFILIQSCPLKYIFLKIQTCYVKRLFSTKIIILKLNTFLFYNNNNISNLVLFWI